jgi:hypothetical protein
MRKRKNSAFESIQVDNETCTDKRSFMLVTMLYMHISKKKSSLFYMTTKIKNDQHNRYLMLLICWAWISLTTLQVECWILNDKAPIMVSVQQADDVH